MKNTQSGRVGISILIIAIFIVLAIMSIVLLMGRRTPNTTAIGTTSPTITDDNIPAARFTDGLGTPDATTKYELDEFGAGVAQRDVFMRDINGDGEPDRITRTRVENGTDHYYDDYKIELRDGNTWRDITPENMRTVEAADCALARFQFVFRPTFRIVKIARPWRDTWTTPTMASRTIYRMNGDQLRPGGTEPVKEVCNVADLF